MDSNKIKRLQFAKMLQMFAEVVTDKGTLIFEGDLIEGAEVLIQNENGDLVTPENGDYVVDDTKVITVSEGVVTKIEIKEKTDQQPDVTETVVTDVEEEPKPDEKDMEIERLRAENEQLKAEILAKDNEIERLQNELQKTVDEPVSVTIREDMSEAQQKHNNIVEALKRIKK